MHSRSSLDSAKPLHMSPLHDMAFHSALRSLPASTMPLNMSRLMSTSHASMQARTESAWQGIARCTPLSLYAEQIRLQAC